ncbi:hypothetical protein DUZ99_05245 [Xylanibacillus composti]|uniref:YlaH-like protein n=1 Tax=Xylanibacillus composti TaxID=1572762 RepID=A0A8J4H3H1_9BACL|nr:YlaH-like family protein [Xylanibacillus composti]MDT9724393.1 hypothetical protein [Xylanibacillus composti]GIQ67988.1 hypothetical protein XYCOK13_08120 [Xylanibacillus composti]
MQESVPTNAANEVEIPAFDWSAFLTDKERYLGLALPNWVTWILIFLFLSYIYNKVFRVRKLPILKDLIVYAIMLAGAFLLLIFQVDAGLPILYSLTVAVLLMFTVRVRYWVEERRKGSEAGGGKNV